MAGFTKRVKTEADLLATQTALSRLPSVIPEVLAAQSNRSTQAESAVTAVLEASTADFGARQNVPPAAQYVVGRVYEVPVALLTSNPVGPRSIYPPAAVDEMAMKLKADGQRQSATAFVTKAGVLTMIDGETRLRAARQLGWTTLRIEFKAEPENERLLYEDARSANSDRREQSPLDDAIRWRDLLDRQVYTSQGDLAKALGIGGDVISRTLSLAEIPLRVVHILSDTPEALSLRMLNAIREYFQVAGEEDTIELIYKVRKDDLGYREVVAMRKAAEQPPAKRPRSEKEPFTYKGVRGELRIFTETGRVELAIKGLPPAEVDVLHAKLKEALTGL